MSHLCALIQFIHNVCLDDEEVNNMLKEIDDMSRENAKLENQLEECDREHVRLQIQFYNIEMITSFIDISAINNLNQISKKMHNDYIELKNLINNIDFTKILKCYHMEMETKCRKEWQQIQDCVAKTLEWHEKMEQRHIVKKYRQAEVVYREAEEANKNQEKSMNHSLRQSWELLSKAKEKRNYLILNLIKGSIELNGVDAKMSKLNEYEVYIESLRQEKFKLASQLEQTHLRAFNPILSLNNNQSFSVASNASNEISNFIMPKLPSFPDILKSFNQTANLTSIENTTNICVKSILTTSKKSITTKKTRSVHFKMEIETESENDMQIEELTALNFVEINNKCQEEKENLQEMKELESNIEIVDLLTPADNLGEKAEQNDATDSANYTANSKNQIDKKSLIQDCIIFKTPFPIKEVLNNEYKETVASSSNKKSCAQKNNETNSSNSTQADINAMLNTTFYEEFLEASSSAESSPQKSIEGNSKNDEHFGSFLEGNKDVLFESNNSNKETETIETFEKCLANKTSSSEVQEFLDFDCNKEFAFDSDDNMMDNYNPGNMDFM